MAGCEVDPLAKEYLRPFKSVDEQFWAKLQPNTAKGEHFNALMCNSAHKSVGQTTASTV